LLIHLTRISVTYS